jgi:ABC-2 type transport system ATP-binding protein
MAQQVLGTNDKIVSVTPIDGMLKVAVSEDVQDYGFVAELLVRNGLHLTMLKEEEVNLETAFMRLTKGNVQ